MLVTSAANVVDFKQIFFLDPSHCCFVLLLLISKSLKKFKGPGRVLCCRPIYSLYTNFILLCVRKKQNETKIRQQVMVMTFFFVAN